MSNKFVRVLVRIIKNRMGEYIYMPESIHSLAYMMNIFALKNAYLLCFILL